MPVDSRFQYLESLIFTGTWSHAGAKSEQRFTQDSPVLPAVWLMFAKDEPGDVPKPHNVLINPVQGQRAGLVARELRELTQAYRVDIIGDDNADPETVEPANIAHVPGLIAAELYFEEMIRIALPSTQWWEKRVSAVRYALKMDEKPGVTTSKKLLLPLSKKHQREIAEWLDEPANIELDICEDAEVSIGKYCRDFLRFIRITTAVLDIQDAARGDNRHKNGKNGKDSTLANDSARLIARFNQVFNSWPAIADRPPTRGLIWSVAKDRSTEPTMMSSALAVKADAARRLFNISCADLRWAVIDSGIDSHSPAFRDWRAGDYGRGLRVKPNGDPSYRTRIVECFDFTLLRHLQHLPAANRLYISLANVCRWMRQDGFKTTLIEERTNEESSDELNGFDRRCKPNQKFWDGLDKHLADPAITAVDLKLVHRLIETARKNVGLMQASRICQAEKTAKRGEWACMTEAVHNARAYLKSLIHHIKLGLELDWSTLEPFLRDVTPDRPNSPHGTQVAGILAADWRGGPNNEVRMQGICPEIELLDMRISGADGSAGEFEVVAAMQFILHLNARSEVRYVHGANLSLSIPHDMQNYGCGQTRVCTMADQLVSSGVTVVAAAGNAGTINYKTGSNAEFTGYQSASITDPGNAQGVLTVGATHRSSAHRYGVSYFSSRGPTGDGRQKPELVAPGEKITTTSFGRTTCVVDGTSFAAPHASGAAALLMARHSELIGHPEKIKQVLCDTATDLGRNADFQGAGMIDVLRAIQSI